MKILPRTESELELMRKSGLMTAKALKKVLESAKPGVNLLELDKMAEEEITSSGGKPSFMTVKGYNWTTCLNINDEVVHGIPREDVVLASGDKFSVDVGAVFEGWHTDAAWSKIIEGKTEAINVEEREKFLKIGERALWRGIDQAIEGNRIGDISEAIQKEVEGVGGYAVVRSLVGHGVGKELHEDPEVPGFGQKGTGSVLKSGMTLAIEVIYTMGTSEVVMNEDRWTIVSDDGSLGGLFEMSIIVGHDHAEVLTDWRSV